VLKRGPDDQQTYGSESGPQGYRTLRVFCVKNTKRDAGIANARRTRFSSLRARWQADRLVNGVMLRAGDNRNHRAERLSGLDQPAKRTRSQDRRHSAIGFEGMRMDAARDARLAEDL